MRKYHLRFYTRPDQWSKDPNRNAYSPEGPVFHPYKDQNCHSSLHCKQAVAPSDRQYKDRHRISHWTLQMSCPREARGKICRISDNRIPRRKYLYFPQGLHRTCPKDIPLWKVWIRQ